LTQRWLRMDLRIFLLVSALQAGTARQELPVVLKAHDASCKNHVTADVHPSLGWVDDKTAIIRVRVLFGYGTSASDESPKAFLEGKQLRVCYNLSVRHLNPDAPIPSCLSAEDLEFTISELSKDDYVPHVFRCDAPKVLYYKCVEDGKTRYTIYDTPNCTQVAPGDD